MALKRIAFPSNDRTNVESHFGHCKEFVICELEGDNIANKEFVAPPPHTTGSLPNFLATQNIEAVITGGMGSMAVNILNQNNINVILGVSGEIDTAAKAYANGSLESQGSSCGGNHGDGHHGDGHHEHKCH